KKKLHNAINYLVICESYEMTKLGNYLLLIKSLASIFHLKSVKKPHIALGCEIFISSVLITTFIINQFYK
ncbi:hypothetical protein, partial [Vibrio lentus]|uniref:hypothetical protein n=1 Tax=Vibrio lentus TaxID=136468 RepID=UPI00197F5151